MCSNLIGLVLGLFGTTLFASETRMYMARRHRYLLQHAFENRYPQKGRQWMRT